MENPSAPTASFGSFATWKHCIRWSRGIQVFVTKWQKWGKTGEWANCDGIEGGMWQRARTWGREQLVSDKLRTLPQSTTTCLVHAFKQVAHKLLQTILKITESCTLARLTGEARANIGMGMQLLVLVHVEHVERTCRGHLSMSVACDLGKTMISRFFSVCVAHTYRHIVQCTSDHWTHGILFNVTRLIP